MQDLRGAQSGPALPILRKRNRKASGAQTEREEQAAYAGRRRGKMIWNAEKCLPLRIVVGAVTLGIGYWFGALLFG